MASTIGSQTITVNTVARTYAPSWDAKYASDLKKGNTAIKKAMLTNGVSILRITHDANKDIEKHIISVEDINDPASEGATPEIDKIQITLTCRRDNAAAATRLGQLIAGVCAYLPTVDDSLFADEI